jgi:hypothetical protein
MGAVDASPSAVAELVKALRRNGRLRTAPGQPDLDDTVIATLLEQQSTSIRELEDANARLRARLQELEALIERIPRCKACGKPWPEYGITTLPHGCIDAARAADSAGGKP